MTGVNYFSLLKNGVIHKMLGHLFNFRNPIALKLLQQPGNQENLQRFIVVLTFYNLESWGQKSG